jgi:hypothetical protein
LINRFDRRHHVTSAIALIEEAVKAEAWDVLPNVLTALHEMEAGQ